MKTAIRKFSTLALGLSIMLATANTTLANNEKNKTPETIAFRFVGNLEERPVYQLDINSLEADEYTINFSDRSGTTLYANVLKGGTLSQKFMINAEEVGDEELTVTITSRKTNKAQVYTIKRSQSLVEENVIKRIK